jgi:hypothetical protein
MKNIARYVFVFVLFLGVFTLWSDQEAIETTHLTVHDLTNTLSSQELKAQAAQLEELLSSIIAFWDISDTEWGQGKIDVDLDEPAPGMPYFTVFEMQKKGKIQVRLIHVVGFKEKPMELAHKMIHALFPQEDKLIRNMMGIPVEMRFGNPLSFPLCGFSVHAWVLAQRRAGRFIHIKDLGTEHEDWGMAFKDGLPVVNDPALQHLSYAIAGSFGDYLLQIYGPKALKLFYKLSLAKPRPWEDSFGKTADALETEWLAWITGQEKALEKDVQYLEGLIKADPAKARFKAEKQAEDRKPK